MKCHYEVLGVPENCTADDLKKTYRKLALEWHPDKNLHRLTEATETFQLIQQAYETLIDPQERAWYDRHKEEILKGVSEEVYKDDCLNVYQYFNSSCFKGYNDDEKGFYTVFRQVFEKIATEDKPFIDSDDEIEVPNFGYSYSSYEEVVRDFYAYWQSYCTAKSYSWVDQFSLSEARKSGVGRQVIRAMEKDNKKSRDQHKKARNEEVRALVAFVKKRDKRVQAHKKKEKERKLEKAKKAEELRKQQILERNKLFESYKESEWLANPDVESQFNEIESAIDATFGNSSSIDEDVEEVNDLDALYCFACQKDFRSEKAFKNHENSKKHKENVILLKYLMQEEEKLQNNEEVLVNDENPLVSESENEETSEAFLVELVKSSSSSKSKKKKKKNKNNLPETISNIDIENDKEMCSKLEEIVIDDLPKQSQNTVEANSPNKSNTTCKKDKKLKVKKEKAPTTISSENNEEEVKEKPVITVCEKCKQDFKTRNKLFTHLKESGHAVYINENAQQNSSSGSKKRKKKKC
ncbi:dnaJ homolog subfamily C member 21 [Trichonephila inaurata madagascariensis]|uniref:DnaJ homolog subfamily C member 21 n=1 Tax=Trichonephila inaurata madagascariensis TaxID=2747483 RepID=A0A8X6YPW4_9ARAC|nr:dnaJ homolog subfamily C member 21 [Trichonephila inaurata madagascariensis]